MLIEVTLNILAKDFEETSYMNSYDCVITRALHRAGYPDLRDSGMSVINEDKKRICGWASDMGYEELTSTVVDMYSGKIPAKDFSKNIILNIPNSNS
jgi:hypothetical protein